MEGKLLEDLCVAYLRKGRGGAETYYDDDNVRFILGLPGKSACRCADVLSLHQPERLGITDLTIAEAKASQSANADHIAEQLGTAAAAALRRFGTKINVNLMVFTDRIFQADDFRPDTRTGVHIVVQRRTWAGHTLVPSLYDPVDRSFVKPRIDDRLKRDLGMFTVLVSRLPIEVVTTAQLSERAATGR